MQRVVAITGGFGTLGRAVGSAFEADGWKVALLDRAPAPDAASPAERATQWWSGGVDLTDLAAARLAMSSAVERLGPLNALINVAGGFRWETLADGELDTWDLMYQMNVRTAATASKAALEHFGQSSEGGRIVNIAAGAALRASAGMGAYAASKSGVMRLTEAQASAFYEVHRERPFFTPLVRFMTSGKCMPIMLERADAVAALRKTIGATDPAEAEPGTVRKLYAESKERNAIHASDSDDNADRESKFFFPESELV